MENGASLVLHVFYPLPKDIPHRTSDGGHPPSRLSRNLVGIPCPSIQESSFHGMISSFHAIIPSFHGMISSFHAVFGLRQRDKSAKVIDYNDQVIRVREYLLFRGITSPMYFLLSRKRQCIASFPANVCNLCLKRLQSLPQTFAVKRRLLWNPFPSCFSNEPYLCLDSTNLPLSPCGT